MGRTAKYVLELVETILGPSEREKRFEWALGDPSPKTQRRATLPFDAVWEARKLIIEVDEDQHREGTPHFDKPDIVTVSGVHRGEQRKIYDARKRQEASARGYKVITLQWSRRRPRRTAEDLAEIRKLLPVGGVSIQSNSEDAEPGVQCD